MDGEAERLEAAITLMRQALQLLDEIGETMAAVHLQHSISIATREPIGDGDRTDIRQADTAPMARAGRK